MCCLRVVSWRPCCRRNIVLCPKRESDRGDLTNGQVVLPQRLRQTAFETHHNHTTTSHCGVQNTLLLGRKGNDILLLRSMWWKFPWNESRLTFWAHCHKTPQKNKFILVVSDYFAKWTESCPIPDQEATTVTKKLVSNSINLLFWCTLQLHSNQRTNFELKVFDEVCRPLEIEKTCTTLQTGWAFLWNLHWNVTWEDPAIPETGIYSFQLAWWPMEVLFMSQHGFCPTS